MHILVLILLLSLLLALAVALAVQSGKGGAAAWAQPLGAERGPCSLHRAILRPSPLPLQHHRFQFHLQHYRFQFHLRLRCWFWAVPMAGLDTMDSATTSQGMRAPGSRVRSGALSLGASLAILKDEEMVSEGLRALWGG